jgi:hypothetical protein
MYGKAYDQRCLLKVSGVSAISAVAVATVPASHRLEDPGPMNSFKLLKLLEFLNISDFLRSITLVTQRGLLVLVNGLDNFSQPSQGFALAPFALTSVMIGSSLKGFCSDGEAGKIAMEL